MSRLALSPTPAQAAQAAALPHTLLFLFKNSQKVHNSTQPGWEHPFQLSVKNTQNGYKKLTDLSVKPRLWLRWASNIWNGLYHFPCYPRGHTPLTHRANTRPRHKLITFSLHGSQEGKWGRSCYLEPTPLTHKASAGPRHKLITFSLHGSQEGTRESENKGYQKFGLLFPPEHNAGKGYRGFVAEHGVLKTTQTGNKGYHFHRPLGRGARLAIQQRKIKAWGMSDERSTTA